LVLCLFPFEVDFYQQNAQRAVFVGHPLAESLYPRQDYQSTKTVLLMPGIIWIGIVLNQLWY
jgi:lipid-A-disaccharide synthase